MRASANRTQDNESRAVANNVSCKREERQSVQFVDNSPHTKRIAQFQAMMDKSMNPHQVQLRKFREMIDNSPQRKKIVLPGVTQKKGPLDEDELQFKSKETVQKKGPLDEEELQFKAKDTAQLAGPLDEDELQFKSKEAVQKKGPLDEEELQFKKDETVQCKGPLDEDELQFKAEEPVQKQENRTGLPDDLKAGVENLSGMAMDDVRVHYNSGKPAQLNAYAYTQGTEIHVGPGQEKHLPHEAWHVVQQKQGRVQPTMQMAGGVAVNDDKGLEREAGVIGGKALQFEDNQPDIVAQKKVLGEAGDLQGLTRRQLTISNVSQRIIQKVIFDEAVAGNYYMVKGVRRKLNRKSNGWLYFEGLEAAIHGGDYIQEDAATDDSECSSDEEADDSECSSDEEADDSECSSDEEADDSECSSDEEAASQEMEWSSDEGEYSQVIANNAEQLANQGKSGKKKQEERIKQMDRLRHCHGRRAVEHATCVAVGSKTASQSTFAFGYLRGGAMVPVGTASSAPMNHFSTQHDGLPLLNTRSVYGDGSHVHAEAALIRRAVHEKLNIKHVSVNKDFCPICANVLRSFKINFTERYVREDMPSTWTNPFNKETEKVYWQRASNAAKEIADGTELINCD
ncbi:eCIS core domain-containing protein [Candidatus Electronema sp. PJ]|uniref:eCIS core domain-containing protein n=1 Tax=Candidatus Electronema sp. PJ TaxID=3401572 RepID=UPI003AA7CE46